MHSDKGYTNEWDKAKAQARAKRQKEIDAVCGPGERKLNKIDKDVATLQAAVNDDLISPDFFWRQMERLERDRESVCRKYASELGYTLETPTASREEVIRAWCVMNFRFICYILAKIGMAIKGIKK